ncbi:MAG TPA: translocation/assembly module TamB domain-containing protein, partial [Vicinamibacteria bacterium]
QLEGALLSYRPWRLRLDDLSASLEAERGRLVLKSLSGVMNGGTLSGGGSIELEGFRARKGALELTLDGATLDWPKGFQGGLDGHLTLQGTESGPLLAGTLTLANASYRGDPQTLGSTDKSLSVSEEDNERGVLAGLALDVQLRTDSDVRVDNPFGRFAFGVDVRATGSAAAPRLAGQVEFQPQGYVYWSGRRFTIERALLDWKATSGLLPFVQARATTRVSNYDVIADFSGPLDSAEARLASDPPLSSSEITSLLVTGSTSAGAGDSRALGIVSANFLGNMGRHAGLDSVRIDAGDDQSLLNFDPTKVVGEANPAQRLTITKRLSDNLEATVSLNLSESGKTTTFVSWKPRPPFELRVAQRDDYTGSVEFRHDVVLGGGSVVPARRAAARPSHTKPEVVRTVEIDDRTLGEARPLTPKLKLRAGKTFSYEHWQEDRDRIEAAASRRNAEAYVVARREPRSPTPDGGEVALTYVIDRGPRTAIRTRGLELPTSLRRELRRAWARGDYDRSIETEAEWRVREHLAGEGYFIPRLRAEVESDAGGGTKTLVIEGERGPRLHDRRIVFEGAQQVPLERLYSLVKGKELLSQAWNEPERLERAVVGEFVREGFLAVKATVRTPVAAGDRAVLTVAIEEGPAFTRGAATVTGCAALPCPEVESALALPPGGRYRPEDNDAARTRIVELYRHGGWNAAQVRLAGRVRAATS